ncbi:MAG: Flagellar biosynthesis protein, FliO [Deltaproteobacteria bacterium]|jgi:flagellar biogenesis protein FliO|nr:Flagellar biosynthesis protein, FliO [Deltaproteobacteria bacterium]
MMEEMYGEFIKVILVLVGLLAALAILYKVMGKYKLNWKPGGSRYGLKRVETIPLGYKKFISVVEVKDQVLLIGIGQESISLLAQWKKEGVESE